MAQRIDEKDYHGQKDVSVVYFIREITPENVLKLYEALGEKLRGKTMFKRTDKVTGEKLKKILSSNRKNDVSEMKIACSEVTDSSIDRSTNGVGGQTRRQAGNYKYSLIHNAGNVKDEIKKAGVLRETASDDGTVHDERVADTTRVVSLNITDTAPKVKSIFEIVRGSVFDRVR